MNEVVLDASAILALLNDEPGADIVAAHLDAAAISAVNLSEVVGRLRGAGMPLHEIRRALDPLGLVVVPFGEQDAYAAGDLRPETSAAGLSLGDRACLALGRDRSAPVLTADRAWSESDVGVAVTALR